MGKVLHMTYASSLTNICETNSSFASGVLRVAYTGVNRNKTSISKEVFEKCMKTIYGVPIVCHYDRESDTFGGHDMEVVRDDDGTYRVVNLTTPCGVVLESSRYWWEEVEEADGATHEYLCIDVLLWKRQEEYQKIKNDGITAHSMEISINDGEWIDGIYHVYDFEFTALALIGVTPCFESSALEVYSADVFKERYSEMMRELKEQYNLVITSNEVDNTHPEKSITEGGIATLDEKMELIAKYGIDVSTLDFSIDDKTIEELIEKFEAMNASDAEPAVDDEPTDAEFSAEDANDGEAENFSADEDEPVEDNFALTGNVVEELHRVLDQITVQREWGESHRYWYVDSDFEANEVYVWDTNDWLLYGFTYAVDGDAITIDFDSRKRKKYIIADFDEGEQASPFIAAFEQVEKAVIEAQNAYQDASAAAAEMESELESLREFKASVDTENAIAARSELFAQFEDLNGIEAFEALRESSMDYEIDALEEKCFAIRGRNAKPAAANFALEDKAPKLLVSKPDGDADEPYGGLFKEYGVNA